MLDPIAGAGRLDEPQPVFTRLVSRLRQDFDNISVLQCVAQRPDGAVDSRAHACIADIGVNGISEIDGSRISLVPFTPDVGNTCVGARVNGTIRAAYALKNGDVVEILTQAGHQPSKDWLGLVKTPRARNRIKHVIDAVERAKAVEIRQKSLEKEARHLGVQLSRISKEDIEKVATDYGVSKAEDLYAALGFGRFFSRARC